jgi:hypothetical protein
MRSHISDFQADYITSSKFAFYGQVKQREIPNTVRQLKARSHRPDMLWTEWWSCSDDLAFVLVMPDKPSPDRPVSKTDNALMIGLVLTGVVAVLILVGATVFSSDKKSADATTTPPSTETPVPD